MLGKFAHEVEEHLTVEDIDHWIAYTKLRDKEINKAMPKTKINRPNTRKTQG